MALTPPVSDDQQGQKEYFDALTESLKVLENRRGTNLFNIAAGFFKPTRSGSFGESLGNAAEAAGADEERDQAKAPQIAQMRAALAGQKYEAQKTAQAYGLLANQMNLGSPEAAQQALQSGQGIFGLSQKFTPEFYVQLSRLSPKIADVVLKASGMDLERFKALNEATKTNMSIAQMYDQFGKDTTDRFIAYQQGRSPAGGGQTSQQPPLAAPTQPTMRTPAGEVTVGADGVPSTAIRDSSGNVVDIGVTEGPSTRTVNINGVEVTRPAQGAATTSAAPAAPQAGAPQFGYEQIAPGKFRMTFSQRIVTLPPGGSPASARKILEDELSADRDIYKKAVEAGDKPFEKKIEDILNFDNTATAVNLDRVDKILKIVNNNPTITGILQQTDNASGLGKYLMALGAAAQEGIQAGKFGQFSLPIEKFINTANMSQEQKTALGELSRLISQEFLAGMRANRGLLGVNPTDNDARLFQAAAESPTSLASNIYSWAQGRAVEYESMNDIFKGYSKFRTERGRGVDPASFFMDESSPYHSGVKAYTERLLRINQNTPGVR